MPWRERGGDDGAAAAEFALVLPLLSLLIFGVVEFGQAFYRYQAVQSAAREGARVGAVEPGAECARVTQSLETASVGTASCTVVASCPGDRVIIEVSATESIDIPLLGSRNADLTSRAEFRCETG